MGNPRFDFRKRLFVLLLAVCLLVICFPAGAQEDPAPKAAYIPLTSIDLGVSDLTLEKGETYKFEIGFEPETALIRSLNWFVTDDSVVKVDPVETTVTALKAGTARILAESLDGGVFAVCEVTVGTTQAKDAKRSASGDSLLGNVAGDRSKIQSDILNRYLSFIDGSTFNTQAFRETMQRTFMVMADVVPGTEEAESKRALKLGMAESTPLLELNAVTLQGTAEQILAFTANNPDLNMIFGGDVKFIIDPFEGEYEEDLAAKAVGLGGHTETLTSISTAHNLGYKGSGTTIAVIDTGLNSSHEQFKGRVSGQRCFSTSGTYGSYTVRNVCGSTTSAAASKAITKGNFAHGSHVAGIMAGKNGIAQQAKIIAVQAFSELTWRCGSYEEYYYYRCDNYSSTGLCCSNSMFSNDEYKSYDYLLSLAKNGKKIAAVNMSYGGSEKYTSTCDSSNSKEAEYFTKMVKAGMVPVVAAGNNSWNGGLSAPACISNAYAVGALNDISTPKVANYSNHSQQVDITAPGTKIYSASYPNGYETMSGTSMATPMVTGALALAKQAFPSQKVADYEMLLKYITPKTTNRRSAVAGSDYPSSDTTFSYSKPVLNFSKWNSFVLGKISIPNTTYVRGYTNGITVRFPNVKNAQGFNIVVKDGKTGTKLYPTITVEKDSSGKYTIIRLHGTMLKNGHPYKISMTPYRKINDTKFYGKNRTVNGAPNPRITAITATPGNKSASFRVVPHKTADGFRYNVYKNGSSTRLTYMDVKLSSGSVVKTVSGLTNGTLYYVTAIPYTLINGNKYWGASQYRIYFVPLSTPSNVKVSFANSTTARVTVSSDSAANGIKVLYRPVGGSLVNGCESSGFACSISGLNKNKAYEFYTMKYKTVNGKKHYGPGTLTVYKTSASGLPAPSKPLIAKRGAKLLTFTIVKASKAAGISVLYREGEGQFKLACEAKASTCQRDGFSWSKDYTFYIMQFRVVNGKKVYSPGVTVTNWLTPKSVSRDQDFDDLVFKEVSYEEIAEELDIYEILPDYCTEDDLLMEEAMALIAEEQPFAKAIDEPETENVPEEDILDEMNELPEDEDYIDDLPEDGYGEELPEGEGYDEVIPEEELLDFEIDESDDVEIGWSLAGEDGGLEGKSVTSGTGSTSQDPDWYRLNGEESRDQTVPNFENK